MEDNKITINKYVYFDTEYGRFFLTSEAQEIIYRKKGLICSYSGSNEWCHHFVCEMIDFCSGSSIYNYALGTMKHETELPEIYKTNKEGVIDWLNRINKKDWFIKMNSFIENIIENSVSINE